MKTKFLCLLIGLLILLLMCQNVSKAQNSSYCIQRLDYSVGSWSTWKTFVNMTVQNNIANANVSEYCFSSENVTGWMNFGFIFTQPLNLTGMFLALSLKIQDTNVSLPLALTALDANGSRRGYYSIPTTYALVNATWGSIVMDLNDSQWQDSSFNGSDVNRLLFAVYNNGDPYTQKVWIQNPELIYNYSSTYAQVEQQTIDYPLIFAIVFFIAFCCLTGFGILKILSKIFKFSSNWNFGVAMPFYMALGVIFLVPLLSGLCFLDFSFVTAWVVLGIVVLVSSIVIWKRVNFRENAKTLKSIKLWLPVCLFIFSLVIFLRISLDIGWGAYVDSQTHGLYTSLILFNHGFPSSSFPIGDFALSPLRYPMGFHVLSAFSSIISGIYPGQAVLAVATAIVCFIPSLLYSILYFYTKSMKLSLFAFMLVFFLPGLDPILWQNSQNILLGGFLVGSYPNILGNLICIGILALVVLFTSNQNSSVSKWRNPVIFLITLASLFFGYYTLIPFIAAYLVLNTLADRLTSPKKDIRNFASIITLLFVILFICLSVFVLKGPLSSFLSLDNSLLHSIYMRYPIFDLNSAYVVYGISILVGFQFAIWFLFKPTLRSVGLFYLVFCIPLLAAQNEVIYNNFLWFIQPDRVLILLAIFSFIVTLFGIFELSKVPTIRRRLSLSVKIKNHKLRFRLIWIPIALAFVLCVPSIMVFTTYTYPTAEKISLPSGNDLKALEWLAENGSSSGLILNDRTVVGLWASSFKAMPIINDREILLRLCVLDTINNTSLGNRTIDANHILDYPWDFAAVKEIAAKYNITYIYLTDVSGKIYERGQVIWPFPWSHLSADERILIYQQNPYLQTVFRAGNAIIFKINCNSTTSSNYTSTG